MPTALRTTSFGGGDDQGSQSPEGLLISALLELGEFTPSQYGVADADIGAWPALWAFATKYQTAAGVAPPLSLVKARFPDFTVTAGVDPTWAAAMVKEASASRVMRMSMVEVLSALGDGDLPAAYDAVSKIVRPPVLMRKPVSLWDADLVRDSVTASGERIEVPYPTLGRATGGIALHDYWVVAARLGAGKSWVLALFVARALLCGYNVGVLSLEMTARQWSSRVHQALCGSNRDLLADLRSDEESLRLAAVKELVSMTPGTMGTLDPGFGSVAKVDTLAHLAKDYDLVVVDHMGLLQNAKGDRAIDDWRTMATISNVVREISLSFPTRILGAAQVNREGERHGTSRRPPRTSTLAQSDALGQDATVVVTMQRNSARVMAYEAGKVREGPGAKWFSRFQPAQNRWDEITPDLAKELEQADDLADDASLS